LYKVQILNKAKTKKVYYFFTENEAIERGIKYHRNIYNSWRDRLIKSGDYVLTSDGYVCEVLSVKYTRDGYLKLPTCEVKKIRAGKTVLSNFMVDNKIIDHIDARLEMYPKHVRNIVKRYIVNGFNAIDAVNSVVGSTGNVKKDRARAMKYVKREDFQECLALEAKEHFKEAGIKPADILKKLDKAVDISLEEKDLPMAKELCEYLIDLTGDFSGPSNDAGIFVGGQHIHSNQGELPTAPIKALRSNNGNETGDN